MSSIETNPPQDDESLIAQLEDIDDELAAGRNITDDAVPERMRRGLAALQTLRQRRSEQAAAPTATTNKVATLGSAPAVDAPQHLGRFQIIRELGRGGFGIVFLAHDPKLNREVALKVPHAAAIVDVQLRERFRREARVAAGLDHPNIVPVYEVDENGPILAIVSAYCPGVTLGDWLAQHKAPVPATDAARLMAKLADAVEYAHGQGVLHRDLKPANIIVSNVSGTHGNSGGSTLTAAGATLGVRVPVIDSPSATAHHALPTIRITDFGLAKHASDPAGVTQTGAILGTPAYMAPEQARGKATTADARADIYALGAILYELLTGRPPFRGESDVDTLQLVNTTDPIAPRQLRPGLPRDLQTICLKCLQKEPARRYSTAAGLHDDLERFLDGMPVLARPVSPLARLVRWSWRHPAVTTLAIALVMAIGAGVLGVFREYRRANTERDVAVAAREQSERLLGQSRQSLKGLIDMAQSLTHDPATSKHGLDMLLHARKRYLQMREEAPDDNELRATAGTICHRIGMCYRIHRQFAEAEAAFVEGLALAESALLADPNTPMRKWELYQNVNDWGHCLKEAGRTGEAQAQHIRALELIEELLAEFPEQPTYQREAARFCMDRGVPALMKKQCAEAEPDLRRAADLYRKYVRVDNSYQSMADFIMALNRLGGCLAFLNRPRETEPIVREALAECAKLKERFPDRPPDNLTGIATDLLRQVLSATDRWDEALAANLESVALLDKLVDRPAEFADDMYFVYLRRTLSLVGCYDKLDRGVEAVPHLRAAVLRPMPEHRPTKMLPKEALLLCAKLLERWTPGPADTVVVERARQMLTETADDASFTGFRERLQKALKARDL